MCRIPKIIWLLFVAVVFSTFTPAFVLRAQEDDTPTAAETPESPSELAPAPESEAASEAQSTPETQRDAQERQLTFDAASPEEGQRSPVIGAGDIIRMLLVLIVVVAGIYLLFFMLKRFSASRNQSSDNLRIYGSLTLNNGSAVHVIEIGTHWYVVGSGENGVSLISEITDDESKAAIKAQSANPAPKEHFGHQLKKMISGSRKPTQVKFTNPFKDIRNIHARLQALNQSHKGGNS